jgi:hypothetical protein
VPCDDCNGFADAVFKITVNRTRTPVARAFGGVAAPAVPDPPAPARAALADWPHVVRQEHQAPRATTRLVGVGPARLNPVDRDVPDIGDELAVARALSELAHALLEVADGDIEQVTHEPAHLRI